MIYRIREYCGAYLDPGESCDCQEEKAAVEECCCNASTALNKNNPQNIKKEETADVIREKH